MRVLATALVLVFAATASADFADDFESYIDTAAMQAEWGAAGAGTLDTGVGNPGQSMHHPAGAQNTHMMPVLDSTPADQPIVWEFDLYEQFPLGNKKITSTLDKVTWGWIEFGLYNDLVDPDDPGGPHVDGYGMRLLGNGGEGWVSFPGDPLSRDGWHHFKATITAAQIEFEVWLAEGTGAGGGTVSAEYSTYTSTAHDASTLAWDEVKLGGPSSLPSANGGVHFDNISVIQIPEPATAALLAFGAVALLRRRR